MEGIGNYPESSSPKPERPRVIGSTALIFIDPISGESYLDNPQTYFGKTDDREVFDEIIAPVDSEPAPSYSKSREDYGLLRRHQRSGKNRAGRRRRRQ